MFIIVKVVYGLKSSELMWHLKLADRLSNMGFRPFRENLYLWLLPWMDHYEYIFVVTDDLLVFSDNPEGIL